MICKKLFNEQLKRYYSSVSFGFFFDIDGVFLKGKNIIPAAQKAFSLLLDRKGKWKVPCVFVTNAGNKLRKYKAEELSEKFQVTVSPDQVVMSHSPLRMFTQFHKKHVLVVGQGPVKTMSKMLGFTNAITIEEMKFQYPHLDVCSHNRPKPAPCAFERYNKPIEAIVMFGEPAVWETNLQLILDVLMTNGQPYKTVTNVTNFSEERVSSSTNVPYPHISLLACNMDMQWMAEAPLPRLGHGCFLLALETLYEKLSGRRLLYTALVGKPSELTYHYAEYRLNKVAIDMIGCGAPIKHIYCVGDNPQTDIYGANLYNRYLEAQQGSGLAENVSRVRQTVSSSVSMKSQSVASASLSGSMSKSSSSNTSSMSSNADSKNKVNDINDDIHSTLQRPYQDIIIKEEKIKAGFAVACESILVLTGVVRKDSTMDVKSLIELMSQSNVNHNHRDFPDYPELKTPSHVCHGVDEAIHYVFDKERFSI